MSTLATYIALPGTTAEAMEFWHSVFGGDLDIVKYSDMPLEGLPFEPEPDSVAHAYLKMPGGAIAGSDTVDGEDYPVRDTAYSMLYTTDTVEEGKAVFEQLIAGGGSVGAPFELAPWGDYYGYVFDRFGVMWAISCESAETQV